MVERKQKKMKDSERRKEKAEFFLSKEKARKEKELVDWIPKTELGKAVMRNEVSSLEQVAENQLPLLEPRIIDSLLPDLRDKLVDFRKTTCVTRQGRSFSFRASVLIGDSNSHVGIGVSKDRERMPAIKKATEAAKLHLVSVRKGCGSWECSCSTEHSIPFKVEGKCASVKLILLPAPKGTGLVCGENIKDVFRFAGISDIWCKSRGSTGTKLNFVRAAVDALRNTNTVKVSKEMKEKLEKGSRMQ